MGPHMRSGSCCQGTKEPQTFRVWVCSGGGWWNQSKEKNTKQKPKQFWGKENWKSQLQVDLCSWKARKWLGGMKGGRGS